MSLISRLSRDPHRPLQVTYAVIILYGYLIFSSVFWLIQTINYYQSNAAQDSLSVQILTFVFGFLLLFIVTLQIAAGKNWARWLLVVLLTLSMLNRLNSMPGLLVMVELIVLGLSVSLLFQRPSSEWFKGLKSVEEEDLGSDDLKDNTASQVHLDMAVQSGIKKTHDSSETVTLVWMLITQAISVFLIVPSFLLLVMAAESGELALETPSVALLLIHPISAILFAAISWFLFIKKKYVWAAIVTSFSLLPYTLYFLIGLISSS